MKNTSGKNLIKPSNLWKLFERFLAVMGSNYVDHCVRTAYLVLKLCEEERIDPITTRKAVFAAYFHDIGSIGKSDEYLLSADYDLLHSIDGYLLLRNKSPLKEAAKIVLYHHCSFNRPILDKYFLLGLKIAICDRLDDWERNHIEYETALDHIRDQSGKAFNPLDVLAIEKVSKNNDVRYDIQSGKYKDVLNDYISSLSFSKKSIQGYLSMLSSLFEIYNDTTYNHSKTVAASGALLAKYMGYGEVDCFKTFFAGLIHDLGKIFIPLSILDKPGKLDPEEYEKMKMHVVYSRTLCKDLVPYEILNIATYHHERLDGSGYPDQLRHNDMTELEEIMQVADVLSALLARRSYKAEYPYELTRDILLDNVEKGRLNKRAVQAFIDNHEEVCKTANDIIIDGYKEASRMEGERYKLFNEIKANRARMPGMPLSNFLKKK
ncbi:MAG: HD domain-containing protein [Bacilli bacterium]|nr:HD domain-containing protein [Bacilli bacterium]